MSNFCSNNYSSWESFIKELQEKILPIYKKHEETFDWQGVHGRMHICRAVIFGEFIARFYQQQDLTLDMYAIRMAVAFHDSGREGNGLDIWEKNSSDICLNYLIKNSPFKENFDYLKYIAQLIDKKGNWDLQKRIVHDADVLEIMRPCCGHGGLQGFNKNCLRFIGKKDKYRKLTSNTEKIREDLINQSWQLICYTESIKTKLFNSNQYFIDLLSEMEKQSEKYTLLWYIFSHLV